MTKLKLPSKIHNQRIGKWGEQTAMDLLISKGYKVLERNVITTFGEIDIVVQKEESIIFVEVKTRTTNSAGFPEDAVNARKRDHMEKAAHAYATDHEIENYQLDVVSIEGSPHAIRRITHFENV